ncbi:flavin-nucleotide-binding protein [Leptolyngbya valderiana BDU 20041]|nr:flavin-nucleotide-binding protein [Leptolyngbya valderiana BDU 20041]
MTDETLAPTALSRPKRKNQRGSHRRKDIHAILDASPLCHIGYLVDGHPVVTPTLQWREGDHVYWHGSSASRTLRTSADMEVCLTVSLLDGYVLARSGMNHSANYRSVMLFGRAQKVVDPEQKAARLRAFVEGLWPGRWDALRPLTEKELKATTVLSMPIEEGAAKVRSGPPVDDEEDYAWPIWCGVVPVRQVYGEPEPDPRQLPGLAVPEYIEAMSDDT